MNHIREKSRLEALLGNYTNVRTACDDVKQERATTAGNGPRAGPQAHNQQAGKPREWTPTKGRRASHLRGQLQPDHRTATPCRHHLQRPRRSLSGSESAPRGEDRGLLAQSPPRARPVFGLPALPLAGPCRLPRVEALARRCRGAPVAAFYPSCLAAGFSDRSRRPT